MFVCHIFFSKPNLSHCKELVLFIFLRHAKTFQQKLKGSKAVWSEVSARGLSTGGQAECLAKSNKKLIASKKQTRNKVILLEHPLGLHLGQVREEILLLLHLQLREKKKVNHINFSWDLHTLLPNRLLETQGWDLSFISWLAKSFF